MKKTFLLIISVLLGSVAQIFLKIATIKNFDVFFLLFGILLYAISTIFYFYVLSKKELSWCYSFVGLSYAIVTILSFIFTNEKFSILKIFSSLIIAFGVYLVAKS